jgi:hypothetical protein
MADVNEPLKSQKSIGKADLKSIQSGSPKKGADIKAET